MGGRVPYPFWITTAILLTGWLCISWYWHGRDRGPVDRPGEGGGTAGGSGAAAATDPRSDGWESEVFAEEALGQLDLLAAAVSDGRRVAATDLGSFTAVDFRCSALRPGGLRQVFDDGVLRSWRFGSAPLDPGAFVGAAGFARALDELVRAQFDPDRLSLHFKMVEVVLDAPGGTVASTVVCEVDGEHSGGRFEAHAEWGCSWHRRDGLPPLLAVVVTRGYQEAELVSGGGAPAWFVDATGGVLGGNTSFREQLAFGMQHWLRRVERVHLMLYFQRCGLAVGDVDGDGLDDLYLCQPGGLPNRLFVQGADGRAVDVSREAGVDWLDHTASCLFLDLDNDSDQDMALATAEGVQLLANDGRGHFECVLSLPTADSDLHSLAAADYDSDGDLDLYVCVDFPRGDARPGEARPRFSYHDANDGGANILFRNDIPRGGSGGEWRFEDVTAAVGLDHNNRRHSLAAAWEDYDGDGDQDLYVANDYGLNNLFRNDAGPGPGSRRFVDVAPEMGVLDPGSGMSADWADYDGDGRMDLYVGNMFSSAGSRITRQGRFRAGGDPGLRPVYQRFAKGNSLFSNGGDGPFREAGAAAGVELGRWAWSSIFCDMNNDGWENLFVANGFISTEDTGDL